MVDYTKEDIENLKKAYDDFSKLKNYFEETITKFEIANEVDGDNVPVMELLYDTVRHQNAFEIGNYEEDGYLDINMDNLTFSIGQNVDGKCYVCEEFEIWNDKEAYMVGCLNLGEIRNILKTYDNVDVKSVENN